MRLVAPVIVVVLAGCGQPAREARQTPNPPVSSTDAAGPSSTDAPTASSRVITGCPGPEDVHLAEWTGTTWALRLGHRTPHQPHPESGPIAAQALAGYGFAPLHPAQWIYQPGMPPCLASVNEYRVHVPAFPDGAERDLTSYVVSAIVPNCQRAQPSGLDAWPVQAWAVGADEVDPACTLVTATTRSNSIFNEDSGKVSRKIEPLPAAYRRLAPPLACKGRCVVDWTVDEVDLLEPLVHLKISRIDVRGDDDCAWETATSIGTYRMRDAGPVALPEPPPMSLVGAFLDHREPALLLFRDTGMYAVRAPDGPIRKTYYFENDYRECPAWDCCCGC